MLARVKIALMLSLAPLSGIAQVSEPGSIADQRTGCKVLNAHPQPSESITWSGGCENGFAQGPGILQWFENGQAAERYVGDMRGGQMDGHGILNTGNGGRYEGEFRDGAANGFGQWTTANGTFSGEWKNGCLTDGNRRAWVGGDSSSCR